jgi:calcium-dependent protein kinase
MVLPYNIDKDLAVLSSEARNLIKLLLKPDPTKRLSAKDALRHRWFIQYSCPLLVDKGFIYECFNNIMRYNPELKFQQATLAYMVHHLRDINDLREIRRIFEDFDNNNDGMLTYNEVLEGFKKYLSIDNKEKDFLKTVKKIDQDKSGYIEYEGKTYLTRIH